jgi:hypothetical protein
MAADEEPDFYADGISKLIRGEEMCIHLLGE